MKIPNEKYSDFFNRFVGSEGLIELAGWLVIIDYGLFLISEKYVGDYRQAERIEVSDSAVIFSVIDRVFPLGGGESFLFHKAKVIGWLVETTPLKIVPVELVVEERGRGFVSISLQEEDMEKNRVRYESFLKNKEIANPVDWLDFYRD